MGEVPTEFNFFYFLILKEFYTDMKQKRILKKNVFLSYFILSFLFLSYFIIFNITFFPFCLLSVCCNLL